MYKKRQLFQQAGIALLMSFSSTALFAASIADELVDTGGLTLSPTVSYDTATLRVSSDNTDTTSSFSASDSIRVDAGSLEDGVYYYELSLSNNPSESAPNGRSVAQNGNFKVAQGVASSNSAAEQDATAETERLTALAETNIVETESPQGEIK